jgi:hypothetical protein
VAYVGDVTARFRAETSQAQQGLKKLAVSYEQLGVGITKVTANLKRGELGVEQ